MTLGRQFLGRGNEIHAVGVRRHQPFPEAQIHSMQVVEGVPDRVGVFRFHEEAQQSGFEIEIRHEHRLFDLPRQFGGDVDGERGGAATAAGG